MATYTIRVAKTHLAKLVARAEAGEEIVLVRGKDPVAKIVPIAPKAMLKRKFGALRGPDQDRSRILRATTRGRVEALVIGLIIRERTPADDSAIKNLNDTAFGGTDECKLIEDLRAADLVAVELVAVDPVVDGHILFSALDVTVDGKPVRALALAPMAVLPERQRHGIGGTLVRAGLQRARDGGWQAVVVLGHQDYYPRFGFSAALARSLDAPFSGASFMALELQPGALRGGRGRVVYPPAFGV